MNIVIKPNVKNTHDVYKYGIEEGTYQKVISGNIIASENIVIVNQPQKLVFLFRFNISFKFCISYIKNRLCLFSIVSSCFSVFSQFPTEEWNYD
jgi:hypothetical protein